MDCHPSGARVQVTGGTLILYGTSQTTYWDYCNDSSVMRTMHRASFAAVDASGTVRVLAPSETAWTSDARTTSCTWRVGQASSGAWSWHQVNHTASTASFGASGQFALARRQVTVAVSYTHLRAHE